MCLVAALALCIWLVAGAFPAGAAQRVTDIFDLTESANMAVSIYYDTEEPTITFIAPDGTVYEPGDLIAQIGDGAVCYYIPDAMAGQWQMAYDKKSNVNLDVNWAPYARAIRIAEFAFEALAGGQTQTNVTFRVDADVEGSYDYILYAVTVDEGGAVSGKRELKRGSAALNRQETVRISLGDLKSYDGYRFYLDAWRAEYGLEASDEAVTAEAFSIAGAQAAEAMAGFLCEVDLDRHIVTVDWGRHTVRCDEYILGVFDVANAAQPVYANAFSSDVTRNEVSFPEDALGIVVELSYERGGDVSETLRKEISIDNGVDFHVATEGVVSQKQVMVEYTTPARIAASVTVGDNTQDIFPEGTGSFSVSLDEFDNEITIRYTLSDPDTVFVCRARVSVDTSAPTLLLPEHDVALSVDSETFELAGATDPDCVVSVDGVGVPIHGDGTFVYMLTLSEGENTFLVNARDPAGNVSSQIVVIYRAKPGAAGAYASAAGGGGDGDVVSGGAGVGMAVGGGDAVSGGAAPGGTGAGAGGIAGQMWQRARSVWQRARSVWQGFGVLIGSFLAGVALLICVAVFTRIYGRNRRTSRGYAVAALIRNVTALLLVAAAGATGFVVWRYWSLNRAVNSEQLFDIAGESVPLAAETIRQYGEYRQMLFYCGAACGGLLLLFVAGLLISGMFKRHAGGGGRTITQ
ncbi:MAG: hypothetical protein LBR77_07465 [Lachnospiraceae bacterium]|jgi:hypothetical protein|nr:hypothetical protein [Lachnospiraceae bacterium]